MENKTKKTSKKNDYFKKQVFEDVPEKLIN